MTSVYHKKSEVTFPVLKVYRTMPPKQKVFSNAKKWL